jgi:tetratricopeptide (TPR) repeat protein
LTLRWKALVAALVPGLGHLLFRRHWRGLLVFALFAIAVNGMHVARLVEDPVVGDYVFSLCAGATAAVWVYSVLHVAYLGRKFETKHARERKDYHFQRGLTQYLAGTFDGAKSEFLTVLRLDPLDADARFHLGMTHQALGRRRRAIKAFKRCLADDPDAKWRWEVETQLRQLRQPQ